MRVAAMIAGWVLAGVAFADDAPGAAAGGGDRYSGPGFATRAPVLARHGMAATAQPLATMIAVDDSEERRQRGGRGDRRQCRARFDGAGQLRHRRRSVRDRLGPEDAEALRLQRLGSLAAGSQPRRSEGEARRARHPFHRSDRCRSRCRARSTAGSRCTNASASCRMNQLLAPASEYAREGFPVTQLIADYWQNNFNGFEKTRRDGRRNRQREAHVSDRRQSAGAGTDLHEPGPRPQPTT